MYKDNSVRCSICLKSQMSLKKLKSHLKARHSKLQMIKLFLKNSLKLKHLAPRKLIPRRLRPRSFGKVTNKKKTSKSRKVSHEICPSTKILTPPSEEPPLESSSPLISCVKEEIKSENVIMPNTICSTKSAKKLCDQIQENICTNLPSDIAQSAGDLSYQNNNVSSSNLVFKLDDQDVTENVEIEGAYIRDEDFAALNYKMAESRFCSELNLQVVKKEMRNPESDTESCSDNGKNILMPFIDQRLYCNVCGNGYNTERKLLQHLHIHRMECRICYQTFHDPDVYKDHMKQHTLKVYACYVCTNEFLHKKNLIDHLNMHYEQEVLESVVDLERDYNIPKSHIYYHPANTSHMINCDYITKINHIKQYLLGLNDQYFYNKRYYQNNSCAYNKIVCDVCYQELYVYEYPIHFKYMHSNQFVNVNNCY